ncbi:MAG TPA: DUF3035 domain-containing protein [Candidatus Sulfotelmatobacter sp.]|jgi:hypothetical protein|nr:DUF3035 domain-containing protein [Candidatus Sulfotelmatobacter sp.]
MISPQPEMTMLARAALVAMLACLALSGCGETRRALGYDKAPPDEFTVVSRAPLSQPPDYSLRPPTPGAPRPQDGSVRDQARQVLLSGTARSTNSAMFAGRSPGEQTLLAKAGADKALPDIRKTVNEETTSLIEADKSFTDKILFWQDKPPPGEAVDAQQESDRLRQNSALGKPATDGETPQIVRTKKGWLEGIF